MLHQTDQPLFPGPGVTKNTLTKTTSQNLSVDSGELQDELDKARARGNTLLIAVIALAAAAGVLIPFLPSSCACAPSQRGEENSGREVTALECELDRE